MGGEYLCPLTVYVPFVEVTTPSFFSLTYPCETFYIFRIFMHPGEAAIHHYRACRKEWMKPIDDSTIKYSSMLMHQQNIVCFDLRRSHSQLLQHVATVVEKHVTTIQAHLDIPNST